MKPSKIIFKENKDMLLKKLAKKIATVLIAATMVIGCGAVAFADEAQENIVPVEERYVLFYHIGMSLTEEFIPETSGEYIIESVCDLPSACSYVDPTGIVTQGDNQWVDFSSRDGLNFRIRASLEAGVPCQISIYLNGYKNGSTTVLLKISRVEEITEPEENEREVYGYVMTDEDIEDAMNYARTYLLLIYSEEEVDEILENIPLEELIDLCLFFADLTTENASN